MKLRNDEIVNDLANIEYEIRDGLVLDDNQKNEIVLICKQIIINCE
jgi:hypothetical protein